MKPQHIQQELLLLTTSRFSQRSRDRSASSTKRGRLHSSFEELEQVCRSWPFAGGIQGRLPDSAWEANFSRGKYIAMKVLVRPSAGPAAPEEALSINPYLFAWHIRVN